MKKNEHIDQLAEQRFQEQKEQNEKAGIKLWMPFGKKIELQRIRGEIEMELEDESLLTQMRKAKQRYDNG